MTDHTGVMDICCASATNLAERVRSGDLLPTDATDMYLDRIDERDGDINAYVTVTDDLAHETATEADKALKSGDDLGLLHGVPIALKDFTFLKEGVRHTFGSIAFDELGFEAPRTSAATERLEAAGAVVLGKTNMPEFGHKGVTDNGVVGATATPFDTSKNAGGSSGGSAAAVAAGMTAAATGSDAGGSIRMPAALCGVFGLKPSFGLVPLDTRPNAFGAKTLHIVLGPITRTVADAALLMEVMAGPDPRDPSSVPVELDYRGALDRSIDGLQVAYSPDLDVFEVDDAVGSLVAGALDAFAAAGASVEHVPVAHGLEREELADAIQTTFCASMAGHVAVLKEATNVDLRAHPGTSESLVAWLDIADGLDHTDVALSGILRTRLFDAIQAVFEEYDLLVTPTVGRVGVDLHQGVDEHIEWLRHHVLTWPFNITGHPAASVPAGLTEDGSPVGMQIVGRRYEDDLVLAASAAIERERSWHDHYPMND